MDEESPKRRALKTPRREELNPPGGSNPQHLVPKPGDRNFDDLVAKFSRNIYGTRKGRLRLDIIIDDIEATSLGVRFPDRLDDEGAEVAATHRAETLNRMYPFHPLSAPLGGLCSSAAVARTVSGGKKLTVLDAGGGCGQLSAAFAAMGHRVVLCDVSMEMLGRARQTFAEACPVGAGSGGNEAPAYDAAFVHCAAQDMLTNPHAREALGLDSLDDTAVASSVAVGGAEYSSRTRGDSPCVDIVLFHAVVEWMAEPLEALKVLEQTLKPGGFISCLF